MGRDCAPIPRRLLLHPITTTTTPNHAISATDNNDSVSIINPRRGPAGAPEEMRKSSRLSPAEREKTKLRERHRRAITSRILGGLRKYGGYNLPPRADINHVLRALANEAGWVVESDGTTYRAQAVPGARQVTEGECSTTVSPVSSSLSAPAAESTPGPPRGGAPFGCFPGEPMAINSAGEAGTPGAAARRSGVRFLPPPPQQLPSLAISPLLVLPRHGPAVLLQEQQGCVGSAAIALRPWRCN